MKNIRMISSILILTVITSVHSEVPQSAPFSVQEEDPSFSQTITPIAENPEVEAEVAGQYPPLHRQESLPLGAIQHAWDSADHEAGTYQVNYHPRKIIRFITREFMTTTIVFPVWEHILEVIPGDKTAYQILKPKPNLVVIIPNEFVGVDSSLTLIGESGHVYGCYVRSEGYNSENISDIVVHVRVPAPPFASDKHALLTASIQEKTDYLEAVSFDPAQLDFDFNMKGDKSIAPNRVFSDGIRTWFDYGNTIGSKSLPAIYVRMDGVDTPTNVTREGNFLVAQATGSFTLKNGQKITCVYPGAPAKQDFLKGIE